MTSGTENISYNSITKLLKWLVVVSISYVRLGQEYITCISSQCKQIKPIQSSNYKLSITNYNL